MSPAAASPLQLAFGLSFPDLYEREGLAKIDAAFLDSVRRADADLEHRLAGYRANPEGLAYKEEAEFLIALAPQVDAFVAQLFGIQAEWDALNQAHHRLAPPYCVDGAVLSA